MSVVVVPQRYVLDGGLLVSLLEPLQVFLHLSEEPLGVPLAYGVVLKWRKDYVIKGVCWCTYDTVND